MLSAIFWLVLLFYCVILSHYLSRFKLRECWGTFYRRIWLSTWSSGFDRCGHFAVRPLVFLIFFCCFSFCSLARQKILSLNWVWSWNFVGFFPCFWFGSVVGRLASFDQLLHLIATFSCFCWRFKLNGMIISEFERNRLPHIAWHSAMNDGLLINVFRSSLQYVIDFKDRWLLIENARRSHNGYGWIFDRLSAFFFLPDLPPPPSPLPLFIGPSQGRWRS